MPLRFQVQTAKAAYVNDVSAAKLALDRFERSFNAARGIKPREPGSLHCFFDQVGLVHNVIRKT